MLDPVPDVPREKSRTEWIEELRVLLNAPRPKPRRTTDDRKLQPGSSTAPQVERPAKPKARDDSVLGGKEQDELSQSLWRKRGEGGDHQLEEALDRLRNRWTVDRTATIDQITGKAFSSVRQDQLGEIAESGYLAQGYGLKAASNKEKFQGDTPSGIRVQDKLSTGYMRDELPDSNTSPFRLLYKQATKKEADKNVQFLNSTLAYTKMKALAPGDLVLPDASALIPLPTKDKPVCWALEYTGGDKRFAELMHMSGATASTHSALKALAESSGGQPLALAQDDRPKQAPLQDRFASGPGKKLAELPDGHPAKATATSVKNLLAGLKISPTAAEDPLVKNALTNLDRLVGGLASCEGDATRVAQLYDLLVEEVHLVLARARPYKADDYKTASVTALKQRAPALAGLKGGVTIQPFLVSSGMDASSTALVGARAQHGGGAVERDEGDKSYFEVGMLLDHAPGVKGKGPVIMATLNPSTPVHEGKGISDVGGLIDTVTQKLKEAKKSLVTLILDITIEKGGDDGLDLDLSLVFDQPAIKSAIEAGELSVVLCKSYQKYSTMGSGKIMAGNVTLVGKPEATAKLAELLSTSEAEKKPYDSDEAQLMTHMLAQGADDETAMLGHAAANARKVHAETSAQGGPGLGFEDGLPFMMAPKQVKVGGQDVDMMQLCGKMGLDWRESFSFEQSSCLEAGETIRINTGQESEAGCMEKLYAIGLASQGPVEPQALGRSIDGDLAALGKALGPGGKVSYLLVTSKAASKLLLTARVMEPKDPAERRALQVRLQSLLDLDKSNKTEGLAPLTPEMRTQLARECLRLAVDQPPADLPGQRAAVNDSLRKAFAESGSKGGWATAGGREILMLIDAFGKAATRDNAKALAHECGRWLAARRAKDPGYERIEALQKDALSEFQRLRPEGPLAPLVKSLPYAEDVARFMIDDAPDGLFGTVDATSAEGGRLLDACLARLDLNSRIAVLGKLDPKNALGAAMKRRLEALLLSDEPTKLLAPQTLANVDPGQDGPAAPLSPADLDHARKEFIAAQYKTWVELEGWIDKPSFKPSWLTVLKEARDGMVGLSQDIAKIHDPGARDQRVEGERARLAKSLTPGIAKLFADVLSGKVKADVQNREIEAREKRLEEERLKQEERDRKVKEVELLEVDAIIDRMADLDPHAVRLKALDLSMQLAIADFGKVALVTWTELRSEWDGVFKHVQNAPTDTPEKKALQNVLEKRLSDAFERCSLGLAHLEAKEPEWLVKLRGEVDGLGMVPKPQALPKLKELDSPQDRERKAVEVRQWFKAQKAPTLKAIGNKDECWP